MSHKVTAYLLALGMLCTAGVATTGCGVTGDLYLPAQADSQNTPESVSESAQENTTETMPESTE